MSYETMAHVAADVIARAACEDRLRIGLYQAAWDIVDEIARAELARRTLEVLETVREADK